MLTSILLTLVLIKSICSTITVYRAFPEIYKEATQTDSFNTLRGKISESTIYKLTLTILLLSVFFGWPIYEIERVVNNKQ